MSRFIDLTGQKFERLTVIERLPPQQNKASRAIYWKCVCDCGKETIVRSDQLRQGIIKSCGCLHDELWQALISKNLKGNTYGELTVLEEDKDFRKKYNINEPRLYWKCLCSCGNIKTFSSHQLQKHEVFSCGCKAIKSKGEARIQEILQKEGIQFKAQYNDERMILRSGARPRFDFAIIQNNKIIFLLEYHGEQHYFYNKDCSSWNNEENFIKTQDRDNQKIVICEQLKIPLEIISHKEYSQLEKIINDLLIKYHIKEK